MLKLINVIVVITGAFAPRVRCNLLFLRCSRISLTVKEALSRTTVDLIQPSRSTRWIDFLDVHALREPGCVRRRAQPDRPSTRARRPSSQRSFLASAEWVRAGQSCRASVATARRGPAVRGPSPFASGGIDLAAPAHDEDRNTLYILGRFGPVIVR
jgi:hypothetical protein